MGDRHADPISQLSRHGAACSTASRPQSAWQPKVPMQQMEAPGLEGAKCTSRGAGGSAAMPLPADPRGAASISSSSSRRISSRRLSRRRPPCRYWNLQWPAGPSRRGSRQSDGSRVRRLRPVQFPHQSPQPHTKGLAAMQAMDTDKAMSFSPPI